MQLTIAQTRGGLDYELKRGYRRKRIHNKKN